MIVPRYGSVHRGVEVFARELLRCLDKDRFRVTMLSGPHGLREDGVEAVEVPLLAREKLPDWAWSLLNRVPGRLHLGSVALEALTLVLRSRAFMRKRTFDIILPLGGTWTYRLARRYKHDACIVGVGQAGPVASDLELSDAFVALTPADEELAREMHSKMPTRVIPNGVDIAQFSPTSPAHLREAGRTILCVGAFAPGKRHDLLFDAALRLDSSIRIVCAGQGSLKSTLMQHPLSRQGRVNFVEKAHAEMPALFQHADVFTLASPDETFGIVFLEALASGLPVVAHDAPRQRYVVGDTGFFCDVRDPVAYAHALENALAAATDPDRRRHAQSFRWQTVTNLYEMLFLDLCLNRT